METIESPKSSGLPRREFIKRTATVAAAVASTSLLKTPVYGQNQAPSANVTGSNNRIAVAVIGLGVGIGQNHLNGIHEKANENNTVVAAACDLFSERRELGKKADLKPRARIRAFANIGSEPAIMLTGPVDVTKKVLKRAGMTLADIDLFELNEAFASVVLRYMQAFQIDPNKINVNGGAIAMGHPLGATGAMILGTVLDELERRGLSTALVTLCIGAGMGTATIIERV